MTTKAIRVNGLVKNYGNLKAVDNVRAHAKLVFMRES